MNFTLPEQIIYFNNLIDLQSMERPEFEMRVKGLFEPICSLFKQVPPSQDYFQLIINVQKITDEVFFIPFLNLFEQASRDLANLSVLMNVFNEILSQIHDIPDNVEEFSSLIRFLTIFLNLSDQLISSRDDHLIESSSLILTTICDSDILYQMFCSGTNLQFIAFFLNKFISSLSAMIPSPSELLNCFDILSSFLSSCVSASSEFPFVNEFFGFFDILISCADSGNPEFLDDNLFAKAFENLTEPRDKSSLYQNTIAYFSKKMSTPTRGLLYAIGASYNDLSERKFHYLPEYFASPLFQYLISLQSPPPQACFFISKCHFYLHQQLPEIISYMLTYFSAQQTREVAQTIKILCQSYPQFFAKNSQTYLLPILNSLQSFPPPIFAYIFVGTMSTLPFFEQEELAQLSQNLFTTLGTFLVHIINNKPNKSGQSNSNQGNENNELNGFLAAKKFIKRLIINVSQSYSQIIKIIKNKQIIIIQIIHQCFTQILQVFEPFFQQNVPIIQKGISSIMFYGIKYSWLADFHFAITWLENVLYSSPNQKHIKILELFIQKPWWNKVDITQSAPIVQFLQSAQTSQDNQISEAVLDFIKKSYSENERNYSQMFPLEQEITVLHAIIMSNKSIQIEKTLSIVNLILSKEQAIPFIEPTIKVIVTALFTTMPKDVIHTAISVLHTISKRGIPTPLQIVEFILSNLQFRNEYTENFSKAFLAEKPDDSILFKAIERLVSFYQRSKLSK